MNILFLNYELKVLLRLILSEISGQIIINWMKTCLITMRQQM